MDPIAMTRSGSVANIDALTMELVEEGEALVAKIQSGGTLDVVARMKP
jgi:hypothetical protein